MYFLCKKNPVSCTVYYNNNVITYIARLPLTNPLDEVGIRIDDLEKNVADLMTQAGLEEQQTSK